MPLRIAIVGSGLAGSVVADRLAGRHHVTLYERGPDAPEVPPAPHQPGRPLGLHPSFAYGLGGSTNFWHGGMIDMLPEEMGNAWPGPLQAELASHYAATVKQLYGEAARAAWLRRNRPRSADGVLPADLLYPPAPFRAAWSGFLTMAELRIGQRVDRVEERAGGVDLVSTTDAGTVRETFDRVVLAAGGLNSPVILHNSGLGGPAVGDNLTDHPMGFVAKLRWSEPNETMQRLRARGALYAQSTPLVKVRDPATGLWSAFYLRAACGAGLRSDPYRRSFGFLAATGRVAKYRAALPHLRDPDFLWQAFENQLHVRLPSDTAYVLVVNEQEATGQGRVRAGPDGALSVDWRISDDVEAAVRRNLDRLAAYTGAELLLPEAELGTRLWSAAHHSGTCRISPDPAAGVVDADLRIHGSERVFVCDGSVLPSTGASNTGLTIAALARRLADGWLKEPANRVPAGRPGLVISGASGAIGRMMRARLAELGFNWQAVDLRNGQLADQAAARGAVFLHLAHAHGSVETNLALEQQAADLAAAAGIDQVVVPMSGSTIERAGPGGPDPSTANFGFAYTPGEDYPDSKFAAERFWLNWQAARPGRRVELVYIPTIVGPRSAWTRSIARHAPGKRLLVPRLDRFFAVTEQDLVDHIATRVRSGLPAGVSRHFALSSSDSLAETIAADRGADVSEVPLPPLAWSLIARGYRGGGLWYTVLSVARVLSDRLLRPTSGYAVVPVSLKYWQLFRLQSDNAARIAAMAAPAAEAEAPPVRQLAANDA